MTGVLRRKHPERLTPTAASKPGTSGRRRLRKHAPQRRCKSVLGATCCSPNPPHSVPHNSSVHISYSQGICLALIQFNLPVSLGDSERTIDDHMHLGCCRESTYDLLAMSRLTPPCLSTALLILLHGTEHTTQRICSVHVYACPLKWKRCLRNLQHN